MKRYIIPTVVILAIVGVMLAMAPLVFSKHIEIAVAGEPAYRYDGFQAWPTPRTFDGPGTVFTITDGVFDPIGQVTPEPTRAGEEYLDTRSETLDWKASVLEKVLGEAFSLNADSNAVIKATFQAEGAERWRISPADYEQEIVQMSSINKDVDLYIIVEAISVKEISHTIDKSLLSNIDTLVKHDGVGSIEAKNSSSNDNKITLTRKFDKPVYIFYRAQKIKVLSGMAKPEVLTVDSPVGFSRERVPR